MGTFIAETMATAMPPLATHWDDDESDLDHNPSALDDVPISKADRKRLRKQQRQNRAA